MATLRITRLGHGGILYQSPGDKWLWVDRWSGAPTYVAPPEPWSVDVIAPTHMHFDHVGNDAADVVELAARGGTVVGSHEMSLYLASRGVERVLRCPLEKCQIGSLANGQDHRSGIQAHAWVVLNGKTLGSQATAGYQELVTFDSRSAGAEIA